MSGAKIYKLKKSIPWGHGRVRIKTTSASIVDRVSLNIPTADAGAPSAEQTALSSKYHTFYVAYFDAAAIRADESLGKFFFTGTDTGSAIRSDVKVHFGISLVDIPEGPDYTQLNDDVANIDIYHKEIAEEIKFRTFINDKYTSTDTLPENVEVGDSKVVILAQRHPQYIADLLTNGFVVNVGGTEVPMGTEFDQLNTDITGLPTGMAADSDVFAAAFDLDLIGSPGEYFIFCWVSVDTMYITEDSDESTIVIK